MRVYIAGPMTGYPEFNFPAFDAADARLRAAGHEPVNPATMDREIDGFDGTGDASAIHPKHVYMQRDLPAVLSCDAVAVLPKWWESEGARNEVAVAVMTGKPILNSGSLKPIDTPLVMAAIEEFRRPGWLV